MAPGTLSKVMPDRVEAVKVHVGSMPPDMDELMPDLLPKTMDALMPTYLPQLPPPPGAPVHRLPEERHARRPREGKSRIGT